MRRGPKIAIGIAVALVVLLALNTIVLREETKSAQVTVEGGEILQLSGGEVQVTVSGPREGPAIALIHCYTCAIDWWDEMIPLLERRHRVIAIDLLGHGGSEKPSSGYAIEEQAALVAEALSRLGVEQATVVGHSLGGTVATALAEQSPDLVDGLVILDQAPDNSFGELDLLARLSYAPVIGEAIWRLAPDFAVKEGLAQAFAPGFDVPDAFVEDLRRMTFTSYEESVDAEDEFSEEAPLDQRAQAAGVPLLVAFGAEDQIYDAREALSAYAAVAGARTELIEGAGHSPNVEAPAETARLVLGFAREVAREQAAEQSQSKQPRAAAGGKRRPSLSAGCGDAIIGSGDPRWRRRSTVSGPLGLYGSGRDFGTAQRSRGILVTKLPVVVEGRNAATLSIVGSDRDRVGLLYGPARQPRPLAASPVRIVFRPCQGKPRTVWPGGLALADRRPVTLQVTQGGKTLRVRVG